MKKNVRSDFKKYQELVKKSNLFDKKFYLKTYRDARIADMTPLEHFIKIGLLENRKPNDFFDPIWYIKYYTDVEESGIFPFIHFLKYGIYENRFANQNEKIMYEKLLKKGFDVEFYKNKYEDLKKLNDDFDYILHYVRYGQYEGREIRFLENEKQNTIKLDNKIDIPDWFKEDLYLQCNIDVKEAVESGSYSSGYEHFYKYGSEEVKNGQRIIYPNIGYFCEEDYLSKRPDVEKAIEHGDFKDAYEHYLLFGAYEIYQENKSIIEATNSLKLSPYELWQKHNKLTKNRQNYLLNNLSKIKRDIKFSIIIPVYNPPLKYLKKAIESVQKQIYTNWEICIVDDCSTNTYVKPFLKQLEENVKNIKLTFNEKNTHISEATNIAVKSATGDYLVFLDQDDELTEDALAELALYINKYPQSDIVYSDDDKIDMDGNRFDPQFKPDWSPEYLLSFMYCSHVKCVRREFFNELGGFRKGFEGSQDYDFFLRASEKAKHVGHIPRILYHWRVIPGSTAAGGNEKDYSFKAGVKALQEALNRRKIRGKAYHPEWALKNGNGIYAIDFPDDGKSVAIIIPTKNGYELLKRCVESLKKTTYKNYKIYIIDNESDESETIQYLKSLKHCKILNIKSPGGKFSFSYINNEAVKYVKEELLLFLNNDTKVINPKWLSQMVGYMQFEGVGSVGAKLIFPDGRIQHAGILHNISHGFPMTSGRLQAQWEWGYMASNVSSKNFLAVTAACMLTPKKLFEQLGGFDEKDFAVAFNDCDYGYRLYKAGYRNVLAPEAELYHYEGATRGHGDKPIEEANYIRKYGKWKDPYYNPNLALNCSDYKIDAKTVVLHKIPKFKIAMVTHSMNLEGAPKSFFEIAKSLKRNGEIEPIVLSHVSGPLEEFYREEGIEVHIIENFNLFQLDSKEAIDSFLLKQAKLLKSLDVDVVYGNTIESFWAIQCAELLDLPSIWNIRESEEPFSSYNHNINIKNLMIESIEYPYRVVFVADATKQVYEPLNTQNNFITIYNGFDEEMAKKKIENLTPEKCRKKLNIEKNELCILTVGTVCERKGQIDLVKAVKKLDDEIVKKLKIFIVGDRKSLDYSKQMHDLINALPQHKKDKITVVDETLDVYKYYLASDIFVCSSRVESFPKVIQEAMYFKLAIITTPVFGIVEQVKDNVSALYYEPGNIEQLANNIVKVTKDEALRKTLASNAKAALGIFPTIEEMGNAYKEVFKEAWLS